ARRLMCSISCPSTTLRDASRPWRSTCRGAAGRSGASRRSSERTSPDCSRQPGAAELKTIFEAIVEKRGGHVVTAWPSAWTAWYTIVLMMIAYILSFIARIILGLLAGPIAADWNLADDAIGLLYGFGFAIFYATVGIPLACAIDRFNRRAIAIAGVALW